MDTSSAFFFFSSRRRHTRCSRDWSSDVCSSDLASAGARVVTPSGMVLDGSQDAIEAPPPPDPLNGNEIDVALVDHLEFYLSNVEDRKSTRLNSSHGYISYAVFCLKKKKKNIHYLDT